MGKPNDLRGHAIHYEEGGGGEGGGDITVEALSVAENGTYTAEEGKAYSPVTVNVPSDFSIAHVTFVNSATKANSYYTVSIPKILSSPENALYMVPTIVAPNSSVVVDVPLYKGKCTLLVNYITDTAPGVVPTASGGVSIVNPDEPSAPMIVITGDGTFTAAGIYMQ